MRKVIRAGMRDGRERIAVVCGAYHAPALDPSAFPPVSRDNALLAEAAQGQGRRDVGALELERPVVCQRLRRRGRARPAGTTTSSSRPTTSVVPSWFVRVARALRGEDLDASTALGRRGDPAGRGAGRRAGPALGRAEPS